MRNDLDVSNKGNGMTVPARWGLNPPRRRRVVNKHYQATGLMRLVDHDSRLSGAKVQVCQKASAYILRDFLFHVP